MQVIAVVVSWPCLSRFVESDVCPSPETDSVINYIQFDS